MADILTPIKAIRAKCLDCMGGSPKRVKECEGGGCPLHVYRFGKNPKRKGIGGRPGLKKKEISDVVQFMGKAEKQQG